MSLSLLPLELKSKIQNNFTSVFDFINYCNTEKKTKNSCIQDYKRILIKKGYKEIPSDKIVEKVFNFLNQKYINIYASNFLFFGGKFNKSIMDELFNKNMLQFFEYFVIKGDYRYDSLDNDQLIDYIKIKQYSNMSFVSLNDEIKRLKYIKKIFTELFSDKDSNNIKYMINELKYYIYSLEEEKSHRIKKNLKKIAAIGVATAFTTASFLGTSKYINKKLNPIKKRILEQKKNKKTLKQKNIKKSTKITK